MNPSHDYLIVGAGFYGAVLARQFTGAGKKCLVIDKRSHIGGNCYTQETEGIQVHKYGPHIFHTPNERVWNFVNALAPFNRFTNTPVANFKGRLYNLPFNMNTFHALWGVRTPQEAIAKIESQKPALSREPQNLEEQALSLVGTDIYETLIKGYTEKQWGRPCRELPPEIIRRLPLRFTYNNDYYGELHQGIPTGGYTQLFERLLQGIEVRLGVDYLLNQAELKATARKIIYTGAIDEYFGYRLGELEYRSLRFETETLDTPNHQGSAIVNYTEAEVPYTRIIEHKHFDFGTQSKTVLTREYPATWSKGLEPYYPINDARNNALFAQYQELARTEPGVHFGGRLGAYKYYDMDDCIEAALAYAEQELSGGNP
jgi:UDP-galactopyranose mutase